LFLSGCLVKRTIKQELLSPNGGFKIIEQTVNGGATTKLLNKIFKEHGFNIIVESEELEY
jgi:hypothetical protein